METRARILSSAVFFLPSACAEPSLTKRPDLLTADQSLLRAFIYLAEAQQMKHVIKIWNAAGENRCLKSKVSALRMHIYLFLTTLSGQLARAAESYSPGQHHHQSLAQARDICNRQIQEMMDHHKSCIGALKV